MRIALLTDSDVFAGTESHMLELASGLLGLGYETRLACPSPSPLAGKAISRGIDVIPVAKKGAIDWRAARVLSRELATRRIDVIHAHNGRTSISAALATQLGHQGTFVVTQHFLHPGRSNRTGLSALIARQLHRFVARRVGAMVAISNAVKDEMLARRDCAADRITIVHNGVAAPPEQLSVTREAAKVRLGISNETQLVFCAARLEPEKDISTLIRAISEAKKLIPNLLCVVAGQGSQMGQLKSLIRELSLENSVRLIGFCDHIADWYTACDVFVLPSLAEPFGLSIVEAMSYGRAVIATSAGGPLDIINQGHTGLLVQPRNFMEMSVSICKILKDSPFRQCLEAAGKQVALNQFSVSKMASAMAAVYKSAFDRTIRSHG